MVTSMLPDGQIAWRHHGLMRIKSAEIAGLYPSSRTRGVCVAVKNSMPDLNLDPGLNPVHTLPCGRDSASYWPLRGSAGIMESLPKQRDSTKGASTVQA